MPFQVGQRVRVRETGAHGTVTDTNVYINVRLENGDELHFLRDGSNCCGGGTLEPAAAAFSVGQRVRYIYGPYARTRLGTITEIGDRITVQLDDADPSEPRTFSLEGRGHSGSIEPEPVTDFKLGDRVTYYMSMGNAATGEVASIEGNYLLVQFDEGQSHLRYPWRQRIFNLDGTGTGSVYDRPNDALESEIGSVLTPEIEWKATPGREYPEEPRIIYGVWNAYTGRPLEKGDDQPMTGWGVMCDDPEFSQTIYQEEDGVVGSGYLRNARFIWERKCLDLDLEAIENPLELLKGLEANTMWLHADSFGGEFYLVGRMRQRVQFNYPRACCTAGLMTMDELNQFFTENQGAMRITDVDGTKITINGETTFHVLPKLIEDFKPELGVGNIVARKLLLQNLASQSEQRDSLALAA